MSTIPLAFNRLNTLILLLALLASAAQTLVSSARLPSPAAVPNIASLPLSFLPSPDQAGHFQALTTNGPVYFSPSAVQFAPAGVELTFENINPALAVTTGERLPGMLNYYLGEDAVRWRTAMPTYQDIYYRQLYPGIDLHYESVNGALKSTYTIAPGVDPAQLRWRYTGAARIALDPASGDLQITGNRPEQIQLIEQAPIAWQEIQGQRLPVEVSYRLDDSGTIGFSLGAYDPSKPLTIDPVLGYSTYLAGTLADDADTVAVDGQGNIYVAGSTSSTDFLGRPGTSGAEDIWVIKLNPAGTAISYLTYLVGNNTDQANDIAVDGNGNVYLTGSTSSTNFPTKNAVQSTSAGGFDFFVTKLNGSGQIAYSTYLGTLYTDDPQGIALDSPGNAHVVGKIGGEAVIYKLSATGNLMYGASFGFESELTGVAVNQAGEVYLTGETSNRELGLSPGAHQLLCDGVDEEFRSCRGDILLMKLNAANSFNNLQLLYSSYFGGIAEDRAEDLALGPNGDIYITGRTISVNYPTSANAYAKSCPSGIDPLEPEQCKDYEAFVAKFTPNLTGVVYSTYYGSSHKDFSLAIDTDSSGAAYIAGWTEGGTLPLLNQLQNYAGGICFPFMGTPRLCIDSFVAKFNPNGSLSYSTYLGGKNDDFINDIFVRNNGETYVVGNSLSLDYPTTSGSLQPTVPGSGRQGILTKLGPSGGGNAPTGNNRVYLPFILR